MSLAPNDWSVFDLVNLPKNTPLLPYLIPVNKGLSELPAIQIDESVGAVATRANQQNLIMLGALALLAYVGYKTWQR